MTATRPSAARHGATTFSGVGYSQTKSITGSAPSRRTPGHGTSDGRVPAGPTPHDARQAADRRHRRSRGCDTCAPLPPAGRCPTPGCQWQHHLQLHPGADQNSSGSWDCNFSDDGTGGSLRPTTASTSRTSSTAPPTRPDRVLRRRDGRRRATRNLSGRRPPRPTASPNWSQPSGIRTIDKQHHRRTTPMTAGSTAHHPGAGRRGSGRPSTSSSTTSRRPSSASTT